MAVRAKPTLTTCRATPRCAPATNIEILIGQLISVNGAKLSKRAGNIIETSGYSSVFPPGIFVGRVHRVSNSSDGQSYRLDVVLGTDFGNIRDVNVVITPYKAEIDSLRAKADSLK